MSRVMHTLFKYFSWYVQVLQGAGKHRFRLVLVLILMTLGFGALAMRPYAPVAARVGLGIASFVSGAALLGALLAAVLRDTLFVRSGALPPAPVDGEGFEEGEGVAAQITGTLMASRYTKRFAGANGGILFEGGALFAVVPFDFLQVMRGIRSDNCRDWWRRLLPPDVEHMEIGTLWVDGTAFEALRYRRTWWDGLIVAPVEKGDLDRLLATVHGIRRSADE